MQPRWVESNDASGGLSETDLRGLSKISLADIPNSKTVLQNVLQSARNVEASQSFAAASVGALCGLLDRIRASDDRQLCLESDIVNDVFDTYLLMSDNLKSKPARRLLNTAVILTSQCNDTEIIAQAQLQRCLANVIEPQESVSVKAALSTIDCLLDKSLISASNVVGFFGTDVELCVDRLLHWAQYPDCLLAVSRLLPRLLSTLDCNPTIWLGPIKRMLEATPELMASFESNLLPGLFHLSPEHTHCTVPGTIDSEVDILLCLARAKLPLQSSRDLETLHLSLSFLDHASAAVRISAFALLVSFKRLEAFSDDALPRVKTCIPYFHQETEPKSRNEFISLIKVLIDKGCRSRDIGSVCGIDDFLQWYFAFLVKMLRPTASYQSHITSLHILLQYYDRENILHQDLKSPLLRSLFDLSQNPYDDVRHLASAGLQVICDKDSYALLNQALSRADDSARRTGRADHADGFGRLSSVQFGLAIKTGHLSPVDLLNSLVGRLLQELASLESNLAEAVNSSLHGILIALRYIIELNHNVFPLQQRQLLQCAARVWHIVQRILCYDAPEGHTIDEEEMDNSESGDKEVLSFCWRALKESSLLMRKIVEAAPPLEAEMLSEYGDLLFNQLVELRHRGAFSTVAETFAVWNVVCTKANLSELSLQWYQNALVVIQVKSNALTRRSAGIPAIITAILVASTSKFFDQALHDLQDIANSSIIQETALPQVHALNCLKDIFTDTRLGVRAEHHMTNCLKTSISCLESRVWAMRNCGLMLLNALLRRINGGTDTSSSRVSSTFRRSSPRTFTKFPILAEYMVMLLQSDDLHKIFPALEIAERFGIPQSHHDVALAELLRHRASPMWAIRAKAAKALAWTVPPHLLEAEIQTLLRRDWSSQNDLHGRLLGLKIVLQRTDTSARCGTAPRIPTNGISPVNQRAYGEVLDVLGVEAKLGSKHPTSSLLSPPPERSGGPVGFNTHLEDLGKKPNLFSRWLCELSLALHPNSDISTRMAAVTSVRNFYQDSGNPTQEPLLPILYQILVDDDDEIRQDGAAILNTDGHKTSLSSQAARALILEKSSSIDEAIWRLTGMNILLGDRIVLSAYRMTPVSDLLATHLKEQNVVFEEEKQNLFLDPVDEAESWTLVAERVSHSRTVLKDIIDWTTLGLDSLLSQLELQHDGPLGWSSVSNVFALFMQVLSAARLITQVCKKQNGLQQRLEALLEVGTRQDLHPAILHNITLIIRG